MIMKFSSTTDAVIATDVDVQCKASNTNGQYFRECLYNIGQSGIGNIQDMCFKKRISDDTTFVTSIRKRGTKYDNNRVGELCGVEVDDMMVPGGVDRLAKSVCVLQNVHQNTIQ